MSEPTLQEALAHDSSVLGRISSRTSDLSAEAAARRPASGGWSAVEHLEHVTITTESMVGLVGKLLARLEENPPAEGASHQPSTSMDALVERAAREKYQSAEASKPKGGIPVPVLLDRLEEAHRELEALRPRLATAPLHAVSFPHRIFGPLTLGQWVAFIGVHEERHLRHIERLL